MFLASQTTVQPGLLQKVNATLRQKPSEKARFAASAAGDRLEIRFGELEPLEVAAALYERKAKEDLRDELLHMLNGWKVFPSLRDRGFKEIFSAQIDEMDTFKGGEKAYIRVPEWEKAGEKDALLIKWDMNKGDELLKRMEELEDFVYRYQRHLIIWLAPPDLGDGEIWI